jgi:hypothetical protein
VIFDEHAYVSAQRLDNDLGGSGVATYLLDEANLFGEETTRASDAAVAARLADARK